MTVPTTAREFSTWRKSQTFATPELAEKAILVEMDLVMEPNLTSLQLHTREKIRTCRAEFIAEYEASISNA